MLKFNIQSASHIYIRSIVGLIFGYIPMKIFGIGLSRTGTSSLTFALAQLGLHAHHFPRTRERIDAVDAVTDTPVAAWYQELDADYPGSRFILTTRYLPDWLDSCEALWRTSSDYFDEFTHAIHRRLYGREDFDRLAFAIAYDRHKEEVLNHFACRNNDLLVMDICGGDGWEQLCPFLQVDRPLSRFPRRNARDVLGHDWINDCPPFDLPLLDADNPAESKNGDDDQKRADPLATRDGNGWSHP